MPLQAPNLDTRTFEDILAEALRRIPRYAPQWTDFNESDPGIALVELFAWLTEMMLYQMNQVPERNYIKFLQLIGLELRPAQPAQVHLTFSAQPGALVDSILPRTQASAQPPAGGTPLIFETEAGLDLIRASLADIEVQVYDGNGFSVVSAQNQTLGTGFFPFGFAPKLNSAMYLGFSPSNPPATGRIFPDEIRMRVFLPAAATAGVPQNAKNAAAPPAPPVEIVWEYRATATATHWTPLNVYLDESVAFTREGYILIEGPPIIPATVEGKVGDPHFWLRARLNNGSYPAGTVPQIDFIRPNTVLAQNLSTVQQEIVGTSEGVPDQIFNLRRTPLAPGSLTLVIEVNGNDEPWVLVEDFLASGRNDPHYILNADSGQIQFGNGVNGQIPVAGALIVATEYRVGGGTAGNVGVAQVTTLLTPVIGLESVTNLRPAVGGLDEQSVDDLKSWAPHELRSRNRAVTPDDFIQIANQVGGVAKSTAIALAHPDHPGVQVPGAITVVVVPDNADMPPQPSSDLIAQVCTQLNSYRLLTTELFVKGPVYQSITVQAVIAAQPYAAFDAVERGVIQALNDYLDPLGNPGWTFGQPLYPTSLFKVVLEVSNVAAVRKMFVDLNGQPWADLTVPIPVPADGMVYGKDHSITIVPVTQL
jgi:hypothetical protein